MCYYIFQPGMIGKTPKLDSLNFEIKSGELIAVIGKVGCGKVYK